MNAIIGVLVFVVCILILVWLVKFIAGLIR
jgi:hypothetical protein